MATSLGQWLLGSGEINFWGRLYQDATHRDGFFEHVFFLKICFLICWTSFSLSKYVKITILGVIPHLLQGMKHPLIGPWQLSKTQRVGGFIFHRSTMLAFPYCFDVCCCFFVSVVVCCPNANQVNICFCWYPVYIIYSLCLFCTNSSPIIMYIIIIYIYICVGCSVDTPYKYTNSHMFCFIPHFSCIFSNLLRPQQAQLAQLAPQLRTCVTLPAPVS